MGPIGIPEMIFIFVLALLIFGPRKLPELGRSFGKGIAEFRKASNELRDTFQREMDNIDRENQELKDVTREVSKEVKSSYYDDSEDDYYSDYDDKPYDEDVSNSKEKPSSASSKEADKGDAAAPEPSVASSTSGADQEKTVA